MPPNSFCEWMLGQNVVAQTRRKPLRSVVSLEVLTDDESGSDVYSIAVPRRESAPASAPNSVPAKQVRFNGAAATKPAIKPPKQIVVDSDREETTDVSEAVSDDDETPVETPDPTCPCTKCIEGRRRLKRGRQAKARSAKQHNAISSGDETEEEIAALVHAKHLARKASTNVHKKVTPKSSSPKKQKQKQKHKPKLMPKEDTESEVTETSDEPITTDEETEETDDSSSAKSHKTGKSGKQSNKKKDVRKTSNDGKRIKEKQKYEKLPGGKKAGKKKQKRDETSSSETEEEYEAESESEEDEKPARFVKAQKESKAKKKKVRFAPRSSAADVRQTNFLMQPRASIMQVEHAVEVPNDPRPNAFYDNGTGTMRVYHGPAYGNPSGVLYPKQVYNIKNTPVGVPHPTLNPWYNGFPSAGGPLSPQDVSPYIADRGPPPAGVDPIHWNNPWLAGYGMTGGRGPGPAPTTPTRPEAKKSGRHDKSPDITSPTPSRPRHKDRDAGWDSNVVPIPSVEVTAPDGSPAMRSDRSNRSGGSNKRTSQGVQDAGRSSKQSSSKRDPASKAVHSLGKVLQELALKEAADLSRRGQRWSDRSSSKEPSPQPGWDTTHQNSSNKNDNNHTKNGSNNGGAWNNTTNNNTGNADDWATTNNTNADAGGGGGSWDNAWGGDGNANNDTFANNDAGWGESSNNNGGNTNNNGDADWGNDGNNDTWNSPADNNADTNNEGEPSSPKLSPIPGTWNSPVASPIYSSASKDSNKVPSHTSGDNVIGEASSVNSKGSSKGKAKSSGPDWGDQSVAQDTGGFWGTEEGHVAEENSRQIKADRAKKARESSNGSWW